MSHKQPTSRSLFWQSISFRFLAINILLIITPVLSLGYLSLGVAMRAVDSQSTRAALREVVQLREVTDSYLRHLDAITKAIYRRNVLPSMPSPYDYLSDFTGFYPVTGPEGDDLRTKVIDDYLDWVTRLDPAITNAFVVTAEGHLFSVDNGLYRTRMKPGYSFLSQDWFRRSRLQQATRLMVWGPGEVNSDYLLLQDRPLLTCARNVYDISGRPGLPYLATLVINVDVKAMIGTGRASRANGLQQVQVVTGDGRLVSCSEGQDDGRIWNAFDDLRDSLVDGEGQFRQDLNGRRQVVSYLRSPVTGWWFLGLADYESLTSHTQRIVRYTYAVLILFMALALLAAWVANRSFAWPVRRLLQAMRQIEQGDFGAAVTPVPYGELGQIAVRLNKMTGRLKEYIDRAYIAELREREAQLEALHSQINPHFLYNALESIRMNVQEAGDGQSAEAVHSLARLIRSHLRWGDGMSTLGQEIQLAQDYLAIQAYRFPERIGWEIDVAERFLNARIPKLVLQTLVENAVCHGLESKREGGSVRLAASLAAEGLTVTVSDNGVGISNETLAEVQRRIETGPAQDGEYQLGLSNAAQRLRLAFGLQYRLRITSEPGRGTCVELILPWENDADAPGADRG